MQDSHNSLDELKHRVALGTYRAHGTVDNADCLIGFAFGYRKPEDVILPGISNQDMANLIAKFYPTIPKILQTGITFDSSTVNYPPLTLQINSHRQPGTYLDSHEMACQAKVIMETHGWQTAILIAHPSHVSRVDALCRMLGMNTVVPDTLHGIRFDSESDHVWTRSAHDWAEHELQAISDAAARGWI